MKDRILMDVRTCGLTMQQMMAEIERLIRENPDEEVFLDGDLYAIVARPRRCTS